MSASRQTLEHLFASVSAILVASGVQRLVVAGGETSGAVVSSLGVKSLLVGPEIDPGVPILQVADAGKPPLALVLKSGNFGGQGFLRESHENARRRQAMTPAEEALRAQFCQWGASLFQRGLSPGSSGNFSARLPDGAGFLVTPTNACLGFLKPERLSRLDAQGRHVDGDAPTKEVPLHLAVYDARPARMRSCICIRPMPRRCHAWPILIPTIPSRRSRPMW